MIPLHFLLRVADPHPRCLQAGQVGAGHVYESFTVTLPVL